ncbi:protein of unknown function [Burkholderia multivorans]
MDEMQEPLFATVKLENFVPADHPLRPVGLLVNNACHPHRTPCRITRSAGVV